MQNVPRNVIIMFLATPQSALLYIYLYFFRMSRAVTSHLPEAAAIPKIHNRNPEINHTRARDIPSILLLHSVPFGRE